MKFFQNNILPYDGRAYLIKHYFNNFSLEEIISECHWRDDKISMFGKTYKQARKVAWHGDKGITYSYSRIMMVSPGWTEQLLILKTELNLLLGINYNSVLVNLYQNGKDYMGLHSDDEKELGLRPFITSITLGASRDFVFKHKKTREKILLTLEHGDLLIMKGETQHFWSHGVPKRMKVSEPRLNLTFRKIIY